MLWTFFSVVLSMYICTLLTSLCDIWQTYIYAKHRIVCRVQKRNVCNCIFIGDFKLFAPQIPFERKIVVCRIHEMRTVTCIRQYLYIYTAQYVAKILLELSNIAAGFICIVYTSLFCSFSMPYMRQIHFTCVLRKRISTSCVVRPLISIIYIWDESNRWNDFEIVMHMCIFCCVYPIVYCVVCMMLIFFYVIVLFILFLFRFSG